jgi:hypothetical protein
MTKRVAITPQIRAALDKAAGTAIDPNTVAVFQASAANTKPLMKKGTVFENATISRSTLSDMAAYLNGGESVPLHTLHMQGMELPVGKLVSAEVVDLADGSSELSTLFYVPLDTQPALVADIEKAIIDEVSVGLSSKALLCSECGWDYKGPDATFMNLYDRVCANEHSIGTDGVHLNVVGLERWFELSLVSKGAARNAKIRDRVKASLDAPALERLAAAGRPIGADLLIASTSLKEPAVMDLSALTATIADQAGKLALATADVTRLTASEIALKAQIVELEAKVAAPVPAVAELQAKLDAALAVAAGVTDFMTAQTKLALVAAGKPNDAVPATLPEMVAAIQASQKNLINLLPVGGKADGSDAGTGNVAAKPALGAFKSKSN